MDLKSLLKNIKPVPAKVDKNLQRPESPEIVEVPSTLEPENSATSNPVFEIFGQNPTITNKKLLDEWIEQQVLEELKNNSSTSRDQIPAASKPVSEIPSQIPAKSNQVAAISNQAPANSQPIPSTSSKFGMVSRALVSTGLLVL